MKKCLVLLSCLLFMGGSLFGQQITVTGKVTNAEEGESLPGVTIQVQGTTQGTVTDVNGEYSLSVAPDATLEFRFIGMEPQDIPVEGRNVINVTMETAITALGEVVVVGYGTARTVGTTVGSISTVSANKLESRPVANVWDGMQGRVSGLQVYSSSGEPSTLPSMRLHGVGSLGASSTPLYVVDGVPMITTNILSMNPNDIESVSVLKDASATSIYGSRAANGVIYITTKQGERGERATVNMNLQYGLSNMANEEYFQNLMNTDQYLSFYNEVGVYSDDDVDWYKENYPHDTQWYKYYYKEDAPTLQGDMSISGGSGRTTYYVSGSYFQQDGLATRSEYERYTLRANLNSRANDWLSFGLRLGLTDDWRQTNPYGGNSTNRGLMPLAQPFYSPYDEDGNTYDGIIPGWGRYDPYYLEEKLPSEGNNNMTNVVGHVQVNPIEGLVIRSQGGLDIYDYRTTSKRFPSYVGNLGNGRRYEYYARSNQRILTTTAEYKWNIGMRHSFTVLAGHEYTDRDYENFSAESTGQNDDRLMLMSAGPENRDISHDITQHAFNSFFGRLDYSIDDKYYIDFSVRQDESSRFGRDNRTANFYSGGVMWDVNEEAFMDNLDWLSSAQIKFSYGTSGNAQIGNYGHLATMGTTQYDASTGWLISAPGNPSLSWETQKKSTLGLMFSLFEDRYRFNVELYNRETSDMLMSVPMPYTTGFTSENDNVGSLRNSGLDFELDFDVVSARDYYVTPFINFNYNRNEVTELFQGLDQWVIPNTGVAYVVGEPVRFFRPMYAGVDPETGDATWYVPAEDRSQNVEDPNNVTSNFDTNALEQNTGLPRYAPLAGGFGLDAGWRNFGLRMDFSFVQDKYLFNNDRYFTENPNVFTGFNQEQSVTDYWRAPGDETEFPRWAVQFTQFDSRLIEDASFMRLKNLTIDYRLSESMLSRTGVFTTARIFVTGRNLLTWTEYRGPDPEVDSNISLGANPNTKQWTLGIQLAF
ncbi:MAG: SusC/RagA family TonB-linked outer membrane protein [Bacteroidales bacterium]